MTFTLGASPTSGTETARSRRHSIGVAWISTLTFAAVMAYADGFWMTSLRGAVGAIERTHSPYADWWRESTIAVPVFAVAVLGAFILALRLFGAVVRGTRRVLAAVMITAAAGTLAGTAEIAASAAYDYHLQTQQLRMMSGMSRSCVAQCLAGQQHASFSVQVHAVYVGAGLVWVTNVVLVAWLVALGGGHLQISTHRVVRHRFRSYVGRGPDRVADLRLLLAAALLCTAAIHAAVVPAHLREWPAAGVFFLLLTAAEIAAAVAAIGYPRRTAPLAAAAISLGSLAVWLCSRTVGLPIGPSARAPEVIGLPDVAACVLELATVAMAFGIIRTAGQRRRGERRSAHVRALSLVAVIAVTAFGLAGTQTGWLPDFIGTSGHEVMTTSP